MIVTQTTKAAEDWGATRSVPEWTITVLLRLFTLWGALFMAIKTITMKAGAATVTYQVPGPCTILYAALTVSGGSNNAGVDSTTGVLSTVAVGTVNDGVSEIELLKVTLPVLGVAAGSSQGSSAFQFCQCRRQMGIGDKIFLLHSNFASGSGIANAVITFEF